MRNALKIRLERRRKGRRGAVIAMAGVLLLAAALPVRAEGDLEAETKDETINREVKALRGDQREEGKVQSNLEALQRQHEDLEFKKRTKAPFRSERSLRHDLRRNEAQQGWQKHESRRLDFEIRQRQQDIRTQTQDWRRTR